MNSRLLLNLTHHFLLLWKIHRCVLPSPPQKKQQIKSYPGSAEQKEIVPSFLNIMLHNNKKTFITCLKQTELQQDMECTGRCTVILSRVRATSVAVEKQ